MNLQLISKRCKTDQATVARAVLIRKQKKNHNLVMRGEPYPCLQHVLYPRDASCRRYQDIAHGDLPSYASPASNIAPTETHTKRSISIITYETIQVAGFVEAGLIIVTSICS